MAAPGTQNGSVDAAARIRAGRVSLAAGTLLFAVKLLAWWLTGSAAVLSDAAESVVNVVASAMLLASLALAARPADENHPYGHGKVEFFSAGVEGTLIALSAALIFFEAGRQLWLGPRIERIDQGLLLVSAASIGNVFLGLYLMRVGRRTHSLALVADGRHVLVDVVTSAGVIAGLGGVWLTGWAVLDPIVAIVLAANILRAGVVLVRQAVGGLMDEADTELLGAIASALESRRRPWWIDVHGLRSWRSGAVQHVDLHLVVPRYFDADRLHAIDDEVNETVLEAIRRPGETIVHFDPCRPRHCSTCVIPECSVRMAGFAKRESLSFERATREDEILETGAPVSAEATS